MPGGDREAALSRHVQRLRAALGARRVCANAWCPAPLTGPTGHTDGDGTVLAESLATANPKDRTMDSNRSATAADPEAVAKRMFAFAMLGVFSIIAVIIAVTSVPGN